MRESDGTSASAPSGDMTDHETREGPRSGGTRLISREVLSERPAYSPPHRYGRRRSSPHTRRRIVALVIAGVVVALVAVILTRGSSGADALALSYARAWARGNYATMYTDLDRRSQHQVSLPAFSTAYRSAATLATTTRLVASSHVHDEAGGVVAVPMRVHTYLFGTLSGDLLVQVRNASSGPAVVWTGTLLFPGLRQGERLERHTALPARASLLARDGTVLAEGSAPVGGAEVERASPLGAAASAVVGKVGPIPGAERAALESQGVPGDATVGTSGLERAFDSSLRGRPGGELLAGGRVLATSAARASAPVHTSIDPAVQRAAVLALGGQLGGVVVMRPHNGEILGVAGLGIDDLQPPGSTFKMVTVAAVLEAGIARLSSTFPYETSAVLDGVQLHNAGGESCGGTLTEAFAQSCNSVFAPLGAKLGGARLVAMAERFGFNHSPGIPGAVESTIPPASQIKGELETGSTAIGQGQVLSSPLQMALVAATVADGGRRPQPTFMNPAPPVSAASTTQAIKPSTARTETGLMLEVVRNGTGTSGAIPGVEVAGKTGTAELGGNTGCSGGSLPETGSSSESSASAGCAAAEHNNTDAWFAAFAPAGRPRAVAGVMLAHDGYGGETAAPVARQALEAALEASLH